MFEEILNCAGFLFLLTLTVCSTENKAAVFPTGEANKGPYLLCLCDHAASLPLFYGWH